MAIPQPSGLARRDGFFSMSRESSRSGTTAPRSSASNPSAAAGANRPAAAARPAVAAVPLVAAVTPRASSDCSRIETPSEKWIRFLYAYPNKVTQKLLDTIAGHAALARYIDMPLQHASPSVLKRMRSIASR